MRTARTPTPETATHPPGPSPVATPATNARPATTRQWFPPTAPPEPHPLAPPVDRAHHPLRQTPCVDSHAATPHSAGLAPTPLDSTRLQGEGPTECCTSHWDLPRYGETTGETGLETGATASCGPETPTPDALAHLQRDTGPTRPPSRLQTGCALASLRPTPTEPDSPSAWPVASAPQGKEILIDPHSIDTQHLGKQFAEYLFLGRARLSCPLYLAHRGGQCRPI